MIIGNILDNATEFFMIKYTFGEIFSSGRATLYKNPSDQSVTYLVKYQPVLDRLLAQTLNYFSPLFFYSDILSASHHHTHNHSTSIGKPESVLNSSTESEKSPPVKKQSKNTQNNVGKKSKSAKVCKIFIFSMMKSVDMSLFVIIVC